MEWMPWAQGKEQMTSRYKHSSWPDGPVVFSGANSPGLRNRLGARVPGRTVRRCRGSGRDRRDESGSPTKLDSSHTMTRLTPPKTANILWCPKSQDFFFRSQRLEKRPAGRSRKSRRTHERFEPAPLRPTTGGCRPKNLPSVYPPGSNSRRVTVVCRSWGQIRLSSWPCRISSSTAVQWTDRAQGGRGAESLRASSPTGSPRSRPPGRETVSFSGSG